jgi:hypothetical protein
MTKENAIGVVESASATILKQQWISKETATDLRRLLGPLDTMDGGVGHLIRRAIHWIDIYASDRKAEQFGGRPKIQALILGDLSGARMWINRLTPDGGLR